MQFFLGFAGYTAKAPFDASMMVHFRKRFSDEDLRRINELVVQRGKEIRMRSGVGTVEGCHGLR
jgi:IS5 family transposase